MAVNLFGFRIGRPEEEAKEKQNIKSFAPPTLEDGSLEIAPGGVYGTYVDLEGSAKSEGELCTRYREMSMQPECDSAIDDIVNEAIVSDEKEDPVEINLDDLEYSESVKNKIREEFKTILGLLDFNNTCYDLFRKWYIDGRLYHHIMIDDKSPRQGIKELRYIDPRRIRKVREAKRTKDVKNNTLIHKGYNEYFLYNSKGLTSSTQGLKISPDSISYCHSGLMDHKHRMVLSFLHKAIKPLNQLRMLEDAVVIYRLARAPERRIFYIDVGNLPKMKAEQYLRDMMTKHKNKLVYNAQTGEVRDDRKQMTMLEDFWLPRREGGRGTEITTLAGGSNLGEMDDVDYFRRKLYKSLNVPVTRMEAENQFNLGRASEITRDELKFSKFIARLQLRFSHLFLGLLEIQLALKGVTTRKEFQEEMRKSIFFEYAEDNHFTELKYSETMRERLSLLRDIDEYTGKYFSTEYIRKYVLRQSEEDIEEIDKQIADEGSDQEDDMEQDPDMGEQVSTANVEPFIPREMTEDDKRLVKAMSKLSNDLLED